MLCFKIFWIFQYINIVFKLNCPNSLGSQKEFNRIPPSVDLHWFTAMLLSLPGLLLWGAITPWDALILLLDATYTRECSATDQDCTEMTLCCISRSSVKKWRIGMSPLPLSLDGKSGRMTTFLLKVAHFSTKLGLSLKEFATALLICDLWFLDGPSLPKQNLCLWRQLLAQYVEWTSISRIGNPPFSHWMIDLDISFHKVYDLVYSILPLQTQVCAVQNESFWHYQSGSITCFVIASLGYPWKKYCLARVFSSK